MWNCWRVLVGGGTGYVLVSGGVVARGCAGCSSRARCGKIFEGGSGKGFVVGLLVANAPYIMTITRTLGCHCIISLLESVSRRRF